MGTSSLSGIHAIKKTFFGDTKLNVLVLFISISKIFYCFISNLLFTGFVVFVNYLIVVYSTKDKIEILRIIQADFVQRAFF